ncbi:reverse transcriptase/maturase family protein [Ktedonobacter robiniae]|uniref:Maturase n=1 Tax=Ktedonobacter robiniae TaxID=2778365 RepID=A0ABQ3UM78_9CHLR|nr:reverse transcriptase/maturase family protein [Ktedonobacter robiniae]GHO53761.1 maturase [Ktedonobacter robiniae]
MNDKTLKRLEYLQQKNSNPAWVNHDLYRLMYQEDFYILAYERMKSKPGNMTVGSDGETLDGFSRKVIQAMRTEQFRFQPVRQQFIPKSNGKMRKLGIPCVRDKVVQEVIHMILEAIYDSPHGAYFCQSSHGFRSQRSCHTALREYRKKWTGVNWIIEGDIHACFDELDHQILVSLLRKKIQDERFLNLIWKLLRAGYMDVHGTKRDSLIGSPQGGLVSPILANVYLHELDVFMEKLGEERKKGEKRQRNPTYTRLSNDLAGLRKCDQAKTRAYRELIKQRRKVPSFVPKDPEYLRIKYLRYADDWIIGVYGDKRFAQEIKEQVKEFLHTTLKLQLSEEKTCITHARTEEAQFLGTLLTLGYGGEAKIARIAEKARRYKRRSTGWETVIKAPIKKIIKRLHEHKICTAEGEPTAKGAWSHLDLQQIVALYSSINRGIQNYYRFVDNWGELTRIQYILQFSLAKTLAQKLKLSKRAVFKRFGKNLCIKGKTVDDKKEQSVSFFLNHDWTKKRDAFRGGTFSDIDQVRMWRRLSTRSKLGKPCCICGITPEEAQIEMHHVRHIRKLSGKREAAGFNRILQKLNRKQIPVCEMCHGKIHQGGYDGIKLSQLAYLPR